MKTLTVTTLLIIGMALSNGLLAQTPPPSHNPPFQKATAPKAQGQRIQGMMGGSMMACCRDMMQQRQRMQADMKAMDEKLDGLVATMNSATGSEKMDAIAAVINVLVTQRKAMQEKMSSMQMGMMQHTMQHMQMGKQSMTMCPMMQGMQMSKSGASKPDDHAKHH